MKDRPSLFERLKTGLEDGIRHARGETTLRTRDVELPDPAPRISPRQVVALRASLGYSQSVFALCLNVSPKTVQAWESGLRKPDGTALRLLELCRLQPKLLKQMVHRRTEPPSALRKYFQRSAQSSKRVPISRRQAPSSRNSFPK